MRWFFKIGIVLLITATFIIAVIMVLWNWLMPYIFDLPPISFWQAAGLLLLAKIFFGFGFKPAWNHKKDSWKPRLVDHWKNMPKQDKAKWKERFAEKWNCKQEEENQTYKNA